MDHSRKFENERGWLLRPLLQVHMGQQQRALVRLMPLQLLSEQLPQLARCAQNFTAQAVDTGRSSCYIMAVTDIDNHYQ
ncbi:hypothetical protein SD70_30220 [Gordoniibacillus kamchatkensis]|uniref:Uncharacterized protein n=1 Tax=Gordoniibacillus kamchatkensis TaxID=1590651 RepID=A0ABR5AAY1_9BACL|nr:hypothetical protein [Paenibacillus sp. VKM B-2647]KIL37848.1 hypothetical protein SD70_30220 [Paenibacillus sp. VKM B-2647]